MTAMLETDEIIDIDLEIDIDDMPTDAGSRPMIRSISLVLSSTISM
ncbi:MAG: hypothetical protein Q4C81_09410 [Kocuria sp.]|nr:hypothetical protein [Kocuria sp.]